MKEFDFIEKYLKPLTNNFEGAYSLEDDVAVIPKDSETDYVATKDAVVENVHFLPSATPEEIAEKLLRINLSDLAAKGAKPLFYLSMGSLNERTDESWLKRFTETLGKVQKEYGLILIGGDTVKSKGELFFSATLLGEVKKGKAMLRKNAKAGDKIFVTGTIGDAEIGLRILRDGLKTNNDEFYINRHYRPTPRINIGLELVGIANASTDCSDGVLACVNSICHASKLSAEIYLNKIPFNYKGLDEELVKAGDDYELVFTAPAETASKIAAISQKTGINITEIGFVKDNNDNSKNLTIIGADGQAIQPETLGFEH